MTIFTFFNPTGSRLKDLPEQVGTAVDDGAGPDVLGTEYDVVIVGGGTSGCVLASRLSEDPKLKVLVLEAGESGVANPHSRLPVGMSQMFKTKDDYDLYTVKQENAGGKARYWPRAKMLGGCSSINAMMYHHCAPSDYDEWAKSDQDGASEWSYAKLRPFFLKFEKYTPSKQHPLVDASLRSTTGPVEIGYHSYFAKICAAFNPACEKAGLSYNPDVNTPSGTLGVTKIMTYVDSKGQRVSTESSYLKQDVLERPNLTVATKAQVTRIIFATVEGKKRAVGVEFANTKGGQRFRVKAGREVVLCAGAIHTPHILLLSGIGPADQLAAHSIPVVEDLPGVGAHLMDHAVIFTHFQTVKGLSLNFLRARTLSEKLRAMVALMQWNLFGTGPLSTNVGECAAFLRSTDRKLFPANEYPEELEDTTSGENAPDVELLASPVTFYNHGLGEIPLGDLVSLAAVLLRPTSTGTIKLKSADPFDQPIIDPNYLATEHDIAVLTRGLKFSLRVARTEPYVSLLSAPVATSESTSTSSATTPAEDIAFPGLDHALLEQPDSVLRDHVRRRMETLYHPTSTARMAPRTEGGVVDFFLRVYGIEGLRVCDCSVYPTVPSGHTSAPAIMLGEKLADIMKKEFNS